MIKITLYLLFCIFSFSFVEAMTNEDFVHWWESYREKKEIPPELKEMEDYCISLNLVNQSSNYWNHLNCYNIQQISLYGYENFKQTVTRNYFTWVVSLDHPYAVNLKTEVPKLIEPLPSREIHKTHPFFGKEASLQYNIITERFINYFIKIGKIDLLCALEEPLIGNPPFVTYKGKRVSQDICNSLLEFIPISQHCPLKEISTVIEIGAGSGRTAFCFLSLLPQIKYIIVDFPPALYVSQTYLSDVFHDKKIMKFRPFSEFKEIEKEFSEANIIFLTPDQLSKLPDKSADLFLAIDCLHEMKPQMIDHYFNEAERTSSYFYFKCWQNTTVPFDGISYSQNSYPVHKNWTELFNEPCVVPSGFFHAFYKF